MNVTETGRHFKVLEHPAYVTGKTAPLAQQSSAIGDYDDALERPGTSYLWIGREHHLSREEVAELVAHLQRWIDHGTLILASDQDGEIGNR